MTYFASDLEQWKQLQERDSKLKKLVMKVGIENNPERADELVYLFTRNCNGTGYFSSKDEAKLAEYLWRKTL